MSCLSFAMLTIDDSYFGEQAAIALLKMAREPAGRDRLLSHATSILMMEGVATTACFHGAAIKLLDVLCEDERGRACIRSLIEALCQEPAPEREKDADESGELDENESGAAKLGADGEAEEGNGTGREMDAAPAIGDEDPGAGAGVGGVVLSLVGISVGDADKRAGSDADEGSGDEGSADDGSTDDDHDHDHADGGGHDGHHHGDGHHHHGDGDEDLPTWQRFKDRVHSNYTRNPRHNLL